MRITGRQPATVQGGQSNVARLTNAERFIQNNVPARHHADVRAAFGSDIRATTLPRDVTVFRYYGGGSQPSSFWATPNKVANPRAELALPRSNTAEHVRAITLPRGTRVLEGTVAPNFRQPGGGYQFYIPTGLN